MELPSRGSLDVCLRATPTIDSDHIKIIETAQQVTYGSDDNMERAVRLFYFVRDSIKYNVYMISVFEDDFKASRVLGWGKGYCVQKAVLLTALARAVGIPSRLVFAKIKNHRLPPHVFDFTGTDTFPRHGYNQFFLNRKWVNAAATFDRKLCENNSLPAVEFNGKEDAVLPNRDLQGRPYITYLEKFSPTADLPFEWIVQKVSRIVGKDKRPWLEKK